MVQRMHQRVIAPGSAQQFDGAVGDDLIHVHVGGGASSALQSVHRKLIGHAAVGNFGGGLKNGRAQT